MCWEKPRLEELAVSLPIQEMGYRLLGLWGSLLDGLPEAFTAAFARMVELGRVDSSGTLAVKRERTLKK